MLQTSRRPVEAPSLAASFRRVALVHHWLVRRRGGERCLASLARLLPGADLFTLVHDEHACPAPEGVRRVVTSAAQRWPGPRRFRALLPLFPRLYGALDLSGYDLVVTSDAALAKCVRPDPGALHVCYCYSPVRWAWDLREVYLARSVPAPLRPVARAALAGVRRADAHAAARVHRFLAPSEHVRARIRRCYGRDAAVVHPPVDTSFFTPDPDERPSDRPAGRAGGERGAADAPAGLDPASRPYLVLGEAVPYKRFDVALAACRRLGRALVVAGGGPEWRRLQAGADPRVTFVHAPGDEQVRALYRGCRALLFPGEEDFGLVPLEALACGRPAIALARGGATETVVDGVTGVLYPPDERDPVSALVGALRRFESAERSFSSSNAVARAGMFSVEAHERAMSAALAEVAGSAGPPEAVRHVVEG